MKTQHKLEAEFQKAFEQHVKGNLERAQALYKNILKKVPLHFDSLRHLGISYQDRQMFEIAERYFLKAYKIDPSHFSILNNLGTIKFLQFKMDEALDFYKKAFKSNPKYVPVINNISSFYHRLMRDEECMKFSKLALSIEPNNITAKINYAKALSIGGKLNQASEAIEIFKLILKNNPDSNNYKNLATAHRNAGNLEESHLCFIKALECDPNDTGSFFNLSASKLNEPNEKILIDFEKKLKSKDLVYSDKGAIAFALYNNYHKLKNYEKASKFLVLGNKFMDNWINTNINDEEKFLNEIKEMFTINYINKNKLTSELNKSNTPKPIFILGMPRSGTTLCEQILSSHSIVFGGGELQSFVDVSDIGQTTNVKSEDILNYRNKLDNMTKELLEEKREKYIQKLKSIGANNSYVTDKLPHNFVLIGFIKILFPNAKIIYCKRDKTDNCFSLYTHKFVDKSHGYCYNQKVLGKYYNLHLRLMEYWLNIFKNEIYVLNHEKLINDQERYTREILDYCELKWEPACLEFYKTKREVQTASNEQVREPINKKSVSAWKKYDKVLEPLIKSLME